MESEATKEIKPVPNLKNIVDQQTLKWIFVGGKGGVGKTTVSSSLAVALSKKRNKVLIISTDPAHSLSDALNQKMGPSPTPVNKSQNLYGMEIDPKEEKDNDINMGQVLGFDLDQDTNTIFDHLKNSIPGIDEALSIGLILQMVEKMNFDTVVFDTAPTGHTLRMLSFPSVLQEGIDTINKVSTSSAAGALTTSMLQQLGGVGGLLDVMKMFKTSIEEVKAQFQNKEKTTFIAVCIPEFLSMYETERLNQELKKLDIDCHNIVINQVIFPDLNCPCDMCQARFNMQKKYIDQISQIYSDDMKFDDEEPKEQGETIKISILPFKDREIRGFDELQEFGKYLISE